MPQTNGNDPTSGVDSLGKAVRRNLSPKRVAGLVKRGFGTLQQKGPEAALREFTFRYRLATHGQVWQYRADIPLKKELRAQRKAQFPQMPLISVVVPLYNTPLNYLTQMINSVRRQSYQNWQLILVDGSDKDHAEVGSTIAGYALKEPRIDCTRLYRNSGIADNTNIGLAEASGEWIILLDHDDILQPNALYEVVRAINDTGADLVYSDEIVLDSTLKNLGEYHFKPDYGPDTLRGCNYITHLCAFSCALLKKAGGGESNAYNGAQDYDLFLRMTEQAENVCHIPKVLYFWRRHENSTAKDIFQKPYAIEAGAQALRAHLLRQGLVGEVTSQTQHPGAYKIQYEVTGSPLVSVLIPSKDHVEDLQRCLASLYTKGGWQNIEVLVVDNNSTEEATQQYYAKAESMYPNLRVLHYPGAFNFAAICNFGAQHAKGQHLLLLNNDIEILSDGFITEMLSYSQRADVGAVGAKLYYPDDTIQHAGLFIGIGGTAGVNHKGHKRGDGGDMFRLCTTQNISAVTGAVLMVKTELYNAVQGMDEINFAVAFNDVDFCLRLQERGLWNVFTPFAEATHFESKSRGYDIEGPAKERFDREKAAFQLRYATLLQQGDPFYNPHFTLKHENYGYR
ncbi:glycosyltransferase family 2 protein [Ruminococcaceae bacterium OttesenSCG-928-A16]|nr:glycosyltransferase family 2 protein [Ruminococcaceae bacterium OttesenSCG-928-A16]